MIVFLLIIITIGVVIIASRRPGHPMVRPIFIWLLLATLAAGVVLFMLTLSQ